MSANWDKIMINVNEILKCKNITITIKVWNIRVMQHVSMKAEPSERLSEAKSMLLNYSARKTYRE